MPVPAGGPPLAAPFQLQGEGVVVSSLRYAEGGGAVTMRLYNSSAVEAKAALIGAEGRPLSAALWRDERWQPASDGAIALPPFGTALVMVSGVVSPDHRSEVPFRDPAR